MQSCLPSGHKRLRLASRWLASRWFGPMLVSTRRISSPGRLHCWRAMWYSRISKPRSSKKANRREMAGFSLHRKRWMRWRLWVSTCSLYPTIIRSIWRFLESRTRCAKFRAGSWRMREPAIICRKPPRQVICAHRRGRLRSLRWRPVWSPRAEPPLRRSRG